MFKQIDQKIFTILLPNILFYNDLDQSPCFILDALNGQSLWLPHVDSVSSSMRRSRGGGGGSGHLLKNHKAIGFRSNTGPDPLKNQKKNTKPAFNVGPSSACQRNAI